MLYIVDLNPSICLSSKFSFTIFFKMDFYRSIALGSKLSLLIVFGKPSSHYHMQVYA